MDTVATIEATAPIGTQLIADLRNRIVSGGLQPGTRLSEQEIAAAYGLSRQPVRETFIKLAGERLVEIRPQRGTFVCKINMYDVTQGQFVREAVEADIARIAARTADAATIGMLRDLVTEQRNARDGDGSSFFALDERFHQALAGAAGRAGVWAHIQPIKMQMDRVRHLTAGEFPVDHLVDQHAAIVEAIAAGDAQAAEDSVRTHLRGVLDDLKKVARMMPHCFEMVAR
ncbi:GntR family transcriptional regulator [Paracoccus sp. 1_MG-2023]|uniref:GntR family transcriptional regulator n=1 Tax=unclassified Paracoccus (in: a-proteobacteria) TaxID=2688777 RepID=UPI001C09BE01|nr:MULTISPECIES: GntR family transcriptional regulator [unclassified Paracoccus (in: a-proteobacteria)]MBU2957622.1 GntR family transcriptional regulator [Paracoccus sp. C2R09]MDO6667531.1 GntR family transcriptional regulator [Paracoccus sp. 1_MG-2023]